MAVQAHAAVDRAELVARAAALVPLLRANIEETRNGRRLAEANVAALREAGLLRVLLPRRWGGCEADMRTHIDVVATIAGGCASTAWVLGVFQIHSWLVAQFEAQAQADVYAGEPDTAVAAVLTQRGTAARRDGGYRLSGSWPFASGCEHAGWMILGATVEDERPPLADSFFLVPIDDVEITGDWYVGGLRGTGSHSVRLDDAFVPEHRRLSTARAVAGRGPGRAINDGALYASAAVPALTLAVSGTAPGAAEAAFAAFVERLPGRDVAYTDALKQDRWPVTYQQLAQARTKIDVARLLLQRTADAIDANARDGAAMPLVERARLRMDCAWAVRQCLEAVETLYLASGGSGLADRSLIQLAQQDLHAVNMHGILMLEPTMDAYGRVLLGQNPGSAFV